MSWQFSITDNIGWAKLITCTGFSAVLQKAEEEVGNLSDPKRRGVEHPPPPAPPKEGGGVMGGFGHPSTSPTIVTSTTIGRVICFLQLRNRRGKHWTQECTMHSEVIPTCKVFSRCTMHMYGLYLHDKMVGTDKCSRWVQIPANINLAMNSWEFMVENWNTDSQNHWDYHFNHQIIIQIKNPSSRIRSARLKSGLEPSTPCFLKIQYMLGLCFVTTERQKEIFLGLYHFFVSLHLTQIH